MLSTRNKIRRAREKVRMTFDGQRMQHRPWPKLACADKPTFRAT